MNWYPVRDENEIAVHKQMKKRSEETQTLRAGCSKAKKIRTKNSPRRKPRFRGRKTAKI